MLRLFKKIFNSKDKTYYQELLERGALLIDVRTKEEFSDNHVKEAFNIPIEELRTSLDSLNKEVPVILVCQRQVRSRVAKFILKQNGFLKVYDGGSWINFIKNF